VLCTGFSLRYIKYAFTDPELRKSFQKSSDVRKWAVPRLSSRDWADCSTQPEPRQDLTTP